MVFDLPDIALAGFHELGQLVEQKALSNERLSGKGAYLHFWQRFYRGCSIALARRWLQLKYLGSKFTFASQEMPRGFSRGF